MLAVAEIIRQKCSAVIEQEGKGIALKVVKGRCMIMK